MRILLVFLALAALVAACGSDSETDGDDVPVAPSEVAEVVAGDPGEVSVIGYIVIDDVGARLCEVLAESFPPQCGGESIVLANPDVLTVALEQEQQVRWTNERVRLDGTYDGTELTLDG